MRFCAEHWQALRSAIDTRGLSALVADSGDKAASNLASELTEGSTLDNFDPLMGAHNLIFSNAMAVARQTYMADPLTLLVADEAHPEWECPICFLNWLHTEHDENCTKEGCDFPKGYRYEWMIDRAADDMVNEWQAFGDAGADQ